MKSLNHILVIMKLLISFIKLCLSKFLLIGFFFCVNYSSFDFIIFKFLNSFFFFSLSLSLNCVWPFWNSSIWESLKILSFCFSHVVVILHITGLWTHSLDSFEFIIAQNSSILSSKCLGFFLSICFTSLASSATNSTGSIWFLWSWIKWHWFWKLID